MTAYYEPGTTALYGSELRIRFHDGTWRSANGVVIASDDNFASLYYSNHTPPSHETPDSPLDPSKRYVDFEGDIWQCRDGAWSYDEKYIMMQPHPWALHEKHGWHMREILDPPGYRSPAPQVQSDAEATLEAIDKLLRGLDSLYYDRPEESTLELVKQLVDDHKFYLALCKSRTAHVEQAHKAIREAKQALNSCS